jgi:multidrug efflux pump subunit AcrA (membrane-fusion protein)
MKFLNISGSLSFLLRYGSIALAIFGIVAIYNISARIKADEPTIPDAPPAPPPARPHKSMIAANGIVEAFGENVTIAAPLPALVTDVPVSVGMQVKKNDILFQLDSRELQSQLLTAEASIVETLANIEVFKAQRDRAKSLFDRIDSVADKRAIIQQEWQQRRDDLTVAEAQILAAKAQHSTATARLQSTKQLLERLTVRAPRDGAILQLQIRAGEWAGTDPKNPALILGRTDLLQARVDIDEQNASRLNNPRNAIAHIKGDRDRPIALTYEYTEPYIVPKASLTGASTERVDTRVLQIIFSFTPTKEQSVYVGQQIDVFIENGS